MRQASGRSRHCARGTACLLATRYSSVLAACGTGYGEHPVTTERTRPDTTTSATGGGVSSIYIGATAAPVQCWSKLRSWRVIAQAGASSLWVTTYGRAEVPDARRGKRTPACATSVWQAAAPG